MNAFISNIAIVLKERGYEFNDLKPVHEPLKYKLDFLLVDLVRTWEVYITAVSKKEPIRAVKVGARYFRLT
jgi:hypothetical protein